MATVTARGPVSVRTVDLLCYLRRLLRKHRRSLVVVMDRLNFHRSAIRILHKHGEKWLPQSPTPVHRTSDL